MRPWNLLLVLPVRITPRGRPLLPLFFLAGGPSAAVPAAVAAVMLAAAALRRCPSWRLPPAQVPVTDVGIAQVSRSVSQFAKALRYPLQWVSAARAAVTLMLV